jgi:hypothetical protein
MDTTTSGSSRADVEGAVGALEVLYGTPFGGKRLGRFVLSRDQVKLMLGVKKLREIMFTELQALALERSELVISELPDDLFAVIAAPKAARWRKVPKAVLVDTLKIGDLGMGAAAHQSDEPDVDE